MPSRWRVNWKFAGSAVAVLLVVLFFYVGTAPIIPYAWTPGADPVDNGPYVPNDDLLTGYRMVGVQPGRKGRVDECAAGPQGPEDIAFGEDGALYTGLQGPALEGDLNHFRDGIVVRISPDGGQVQTIAETRGRPLGVEFDKQGNLYVCDAVTGLWRIPRDGEPERLNLEVGGESINYTDNLHIDSEGHVWFSSPSTRWGIDGIRSDGMETRPTGRLIRYKPKTGETEVMLDDLMFANGVAMPGDEPYVLVAEWYAYRIRRLWLRDEENHSEHHAADHEKAFKKGDNDIFYENLPGYPDNLFFDDQGTLWVGLVIPRDGVVDALHPHPFLMKALYRIPRSLQPDSPFYGTLLGLGAGPDTKGRLTHNLQDFTHRIKNDSEKDCALRNPRVGRVTGAKTNDGALYITSDYMKKLVIVPPPKPHPPFLERTWPFPPRPAPAPPCEPVYEHCKPERFAG